MIQVNLQCMHCGHSLMDRKRKIDGCPAIMVHVNYGKKKGKLYLSSLYGSYNIDIRISCPKGRMAQFFCPHCKENLKTTRTCDACRAPMVSFALKEGGILQICSRRGCKKHLIEFEDPELELKTFYDYYSTFFR